MRPTGAEEAPRDTRGFSATIRNRIFDFLQGWVNRDFEQALTYLSSPEDLEGWPWTPARLKEALDAFHIDQERICLGP